MANTNKWKTCIQIQTDEYCAWQKRQGRSPDRHFKVRRSCRSNDTDSSDEDAPLTYLQSGSSHVQAVHQLRERCPSEGGVCTDNNQSSCSHDAGTMQPTMNGTDNGTKTKLTTKEKLRRKWRSLSLPSLKIFRCFIKKKNVNKSKGQTDSPLHHFPLSVDKPECSVDSDRCSCPEDLVPAGHKKVRMKEKQPESHKDKDLSEEFAVHFDSLDPQEMSGESTPPSESPPNKHFLVECIVHVDAVESEEMSGGYNALAKTAEDKDPSQECTAHLHSNESQELMGESNTTLDSAENLLLSDVGNASSSVPDNQEMGGPSGSAVHSADMGQQPDEHLKTFSLAAKEYILNPIKLVTDVSGLAKNLGSYIWNLADGSRILPQWMNQTEANLTSNILKSGTQGAMSTCQSSDCLSSTEVADRSSINSSDQSNRANWNMYAGNEASCSHSTFSSSSGQYLSGTNERFPSSHNLKSRHVTRSERRARSSSLNVSPYQGQRPERKSRSVSQYGHSFSSLDTFANPTQMTNRAHDLQEDNGAMRALAQSCSMNDQAGQNETSRSLASASSHSYPAAENTTSATLGSDAENRSQYSIWSSLWNLKTYYFPSFSRAAGSAQAPGTSSASFSFNLSQAARMDSLDVPAVYNSRPTGILSQSLLLDGQSESTQMQNRNSSMSTEVNEGTGHILQAVEGLDASSNHERHFCFNENAKVSLFSANKNSLLPNTFDAPLSSGESDDEESNNIILYYRFIEEGENEPRLGENNYACIRPDLQCDSSAESSDDDSKPIKMDGYTIYFRQADQAYEDDDIDDKVDGDDSSGEQNPVPLSPSQHDAGRNE